MEEEEPSFGKRIRDGKAAQERSPPPILRPTRVGRFITIFADVCGSSLKPSEQQHASKGNGNLHPHIHDQTEAVHILGPLCSSALTSAALGHF